MGGGGPQLDPLIGLDDPTKPLRSRLLAVPSLKARYLRYVHDIADKQLDWKTLGPTVAAYVKLIDAEVKADTRKLSSYEAFQAAVSNKAPSTTAAGNGENRRPDPSLRSFVEQRRSFLLKHPEVRQATEGAQSESKPRQDK